MSLGKKLKQVRLNKNLSQDFMAEMLEVSQKTYSNFENNKTKPDFSQIEKISKILDVSILEFLEDTEKYNFYQNNTGTNNGFVVNNFSEKLIEQYELRIKKLEEENVYLKSLLDRMLK
jgi:DNA-binding helix-turn-helix protein